MSHYEITSLPVLRLAQYTGQVATADQMGDVVGALFGRLLGSMQQLGLDTDQPTVAWYDGSGAAPAVGVGVPLSGALDVGDTGLETHELPVVDRAVVVRHEGSLGGLAQAWQQLHEHLTSEGLSPAGPCREVYLAGDVSREDSWVVDLQQPVA